MAFTLANWAEVSVSLNQGQETVTPFGGSPTVLGAPNVFAYKSPNDTVATISEADYFLDIYTSLSVGDIILGGGTDASLAVVVSAVSSTSVTVASMGLTTSIGTANIVDNAVTYAKLQNAVANNVLLGNPGGGAGVDFTEVPLGNGLAFSAGSLVVPTTNLVYASVAVSSAEFLGAYAAPKLLVAAGGANTLIVLERAELLMTFNSIVYAGGGVVAIQYDSTINGAGVNASSTLTAASFFAGASTGLPFNGGVLVQPFTTCVNKGLYLSNLTGAFTGGNSAFVAHLWYRIIPTV